MWAAWFGGGFAAGFASFAGVAAGCGVYAYRHPELLVRAVMKRNAKPVKRAA